MKKKISNFLFSKQGTNLFDSINIINENNNDNNNDDVNNECIDCEFNISKNQYLQHL